MHGSNRVNVILCGGSGTRLWPMSRKLLPKQFLPRFDDRSLFQLTISRNQSLCNSQIIVSNQNQYFLAKDQTEAIREPERFRFLLEPIGKNTAPAITLAALMCQKDDLLLVCPSDHLIKDLDAYSHAVDQAFSLAEQDYLVTFGITPTYPETGYGYIKASGKDVESFKEKPDLKTAEEYLRDGTYFWNSGIFCFKAGFFLEEIQKHSGDVYARSAEAINQPGQNGTIEIPFNSMDKIPEISIDYALMEKSERVKVITADMQWSDLGCFDALYDVLEKDTDQNAIQSDLININSKNNLILGQNRLIATIDVEDLLIVDTADALLISKKGSSQKVKQVVSTLKDTHSELPNSHMTVHRPWGTYTVLEESPGYKIKKISVKPGKRLSLQKHYHRNEHWTVVSGTAEVTIDTKQFIVRANESTYIPMGTVHRLENPGKIELVIIESQVGEYLGEDDIVRIKDDFNRS